jgi:NADH-quinone oxidoreductase subunit M
MLTILLILIPVVAGLLTLSLGGRNVKQLALVGALAELGTVLLAWSQFDPAGGQQFGFKYDWIASAGVTLGAGLDGISLLLVLLTAFLTPLIILSAFGQSYKNPSAFYSLILFMEAALIGVFPFLPFLRSRSDSRLLSGGGLGR